MLIKSLLLFTSTFCKQCFSFKPSLALGRGHAQNNLSNYTWQTSTKHEYSVSSYLLGYDNVLKSLYEELNNLSTF